MNEVRVITYDPKFRHAFIELNREWIEKFFRIEKNDVLQLEECEANILEQGGEIFFVLDGSNVIGTCAMIPHGPRTFELAKMAVSPKAQGRGAGALLMRASIDWAHTQDAQLITLLSNTLLEPAIRLYKKYGFVTVNLGQHPDYDRANIEMHLKL